MPIPVGAPLPPPLQSLPWASGPSSGVPLQDPATATPAVDAGSLVGTIEIGGAPDASAPVSATASVTIGGTATATAVAAAAGSVSIGGAATAQAPATGSGGVSIGGAPTAAAATQAVGGVSIGGAPGAGASGGAAGSVVIGGSSAPAAAGSTSGGVVIGGSPAAVATGGATGQVVIGGAVTGAAPTSGAGTVQIGGTAAGTSGTSRTSLGSITIGGSASGLKLGVLEVNVGTALSPDWRKIGCGGHPASSVDFLDTFNRADASTLGAPWATYQGTWGVSSNACVPITNAFGGTSQFTTALVDSGGASTDIQVKVKRTSTGGWSEIVFAYDPVTDIGYRMRFDMGSAMSLRRAKKDQGPSVDTDPMTSAFDPGAADGVFRTIRIVYDQPTATIKLYRNGTLQITATDTLGGLTGTWVGLGTTNGSVGNPVVETFDDFTITPAVAATTGRLELRTGTRWVREACDSDTATISFSDNLNRTDRVLGGDNGWTGDRGTIQISSNQAVMTAGGGDPIATFSGSGFAAVYQHGNPTAGTYAVDKGTNINSWLMVRHDPALGFILIRGDAAYYYDRPASIATSFPQFTLLATLTGTNGAGRVGVTISGDTFSVTENGTAVGSFTTSLLSSGDGNAGMYLSDTTATLDNYDSTYPPVRRPLYVWTGTVWDHAACMVPA